MLRLLCAAVCSRGTASERKAAPILRCLASYACGDGAVDGRQHHGGTSSWEKSPGDAVQQDEVLAVIETDKVNVDVRAPYAGVLTESLRPWMKTLK